MPWSELHCGMCVGSVRLRTLNEFKHTAGAWCRYALAHQEGGGELHPDDECIVFVDGRGRRMLRPPECARMWCGPKAVQCVDPDVFREAFADLGFARSWAERQSVAYAVSTRKAAESGVRRVMVLVHGDDGRRLPRRGDAIVHRGCEGRMLCANVDGDCCVELVNGQRVWARWGHLTRRVAYYAFSCAL